MRHHFTRREALQAAAALCGAGLARGQDEPVFSTEVKVVNVLATVRSKTGSLVANLGQDDFYCLKRAVRRPSAISRARVTYR